MLSGISNFLFGAAEEETLSSEDVRLRVTPIDDEWALVDRSNCAFSCVTTDGECPCNSTDRLIMLNDSGNTNSGPGSERSSTDETWIVDPPSCFTGGRSLSPKTGSLENLLLEHPSMSVYNTRGRPNSTGIEEESGRNSPVTRSMVRQARRPRAVTARAGLLPKTQLVKTMHQAKRRQSAKTLTRHHMDRQSKVYNLRSLDRQVRVQQPRKSYC